MTAQLTNEELNEYLSYKELFKNKLKDMDYISMHYTNSSYTSSVYIKKENRDETIKILLEELNTAREMLNREREQNLILRQKKSCYLF